MRKPSPFFALTLLAAADLASAGEGAPAEGPAADLPIPPAPTVAAPLAATAAAPRKRMRVGVVLLEALGGRLWDEGADPPRTVGGDRGSAVTAAHGIGLSFGYDLMAGLSVGIAPRAFFQVKSKRGTLQELDIMASVAYAHTLVPGHALCAELLSGYSVIFLPSDATYWGLTPTSAKGLVLGMGAGWAFDVTDRLFLTLGIAYQIGFQRLSVLDYDLGFRTRLFTLGLGGGRRF